MSSSPDSEGVPDFATQLRVRTSPQHGVSGTLIKISAPLALSSPKVYRVLLVSFYYIYQALEEQMETLRLRFPKIGALYFRELLRTPSFKKDLAHYYGVNYANVIPPPSPATSDYISNMCKAADEEPLTIFSYCHAMYMALLGGGPVVRSWVVTAFALEPPMGCAIFDFADTIPDVAHFRRLYNDAINSVSLTSAQKDRIVEQKKRVFEGNNAVIKEVCASGVYRRRVLSVLIQLLLVLILLYVLIRYLPDMIANFANP